MRCRSNCCSTLTWFVVLDLEYETHITWPDFSLAKLFTRFTFVGDSESGDFKYVILCFGPHVTVFWWSCSQPCFFFYIPWRKSIRENTAYTNWYLTNPTPWNRCHANVYVLCNNQTTQTNMCVLDMYSHSGAFFYTTARDVHIMYIWFRMRRNGQHITNQ